MLRSTPPPKKTHPNIRLFSWTRCQAIPFRASKLTFLLRESLAGNSRTRLGRKKPQGTSAELGEQEGRVGSIFFAVLCENPKSFSIQKAILDVDGFPLPKGFVSCCAGVFWRRRTGGASTRSTRFMVGAVSPASVSADETVSTLRPGPGGAFFIIFWDSRGWVLGVHWLVLLVLGRRFEDLIPKLLVILPSQLTCCEDEASKVLHRFWNFWW